MRKSTYFIGLLTFGLISVFQAATAQDKTAGERIPANVSVHQTTADAMQRQANAGPKAPRPEHELELPERDDLPQNPDAPAVSRIPAAAPGEATLLRSLNIHTTSNSFDGATLTDTGAFPPDSMGTVGPKQFIVFVNGRIRSFTKAGTADGVINADPDVFFASVMTPIGAGVVLNFTSDPQIRYDRFSGRWFMSIIDVPCANASCSATAANRWLLAVSDAASAGVITGSTVWTLFGTKTDPSNFCDYPSLGVDVNALYFGCNMFTGAGAFAGTNGYVVQKTSALGAGPLVVTKFANLALGTTGAGPESPRGVDNFDATATEGYFIGPDNATFSTIMFRRVSNPGSATPTISANIAVTVPTTTTPNPVEHLGNTGGNNGRLDSLDDRIFQAMIRNGHLWAAHNFRVTAAGVSGGTAAIARNASRWYDFQNLTTTPTVFQSGTVYDSAATRALAKQYWIPTIAATGQGHAVLGFSVAGTIGATPGYVGRLAGDPLGTMVGPPTTGGVFTGTSTANYNPPSDPGGASGRRWGDYSFTVVDPLDDMSVWTIQEYNHAMNSYAVRVAQLQAPPPATPTCAATPISISANAPTNVVITGTSTAGSGFYDPGTDLAPPALPFNHLSATVSGGVTVNSTTYNSPTQVTLNLTATTAGAKNVTITNPDSQTVTANSCITVVAGASTQLKFTTQPASGVAGQTLSAVAVSIEDASGNIKTTDSSTQVTLALSSNTLNGTTTVTAVNGVATFSNLSINTAATGYTLTASSVPSLSTATSTPFNIVAAAASKLAFVQQPSTTAAGAPISPPVTVKVLDQFNNPVTSDTSNVTVAIGNNAGGGTLSGTLTQAAVAGVATFANLSIDKSGVGYTLSAADGAFTGATSNAFNITPGPAVSISFTQQPSAATAGVAIAPAVTVTLLDAFGNVATADNTSQVSIGVASGPGAILNGGAVTVTAGVATFSNLIINVAGTYTLSATSGALPAATSNSFVVAAAAASKLVFVTQPSNAAAGQAIAPAIVVQVQDALNNVVSTSTAPVALAFGANPGGVTAVLSGGAATPASAGVATFAGVSINKAATGYTLVASSTGLTSATSTTFNIVAAAASKVVFTTQPAANANILAGATFNLVAQVQDAFNNVVTTDTSNVTVTIGNNPGPSTLTGTTTVAAVAGVATFTGQGITLNKVGSGYTLIAADANLSVTAATSNAFNIVPGAAASLAFVQQPSDIAAGGIVMPPVTIRVFDAFGNALTSSVTVVNLAIASGPAATLLGGGSLNDSAGLVTYNALSLHVPGTYTLVATSAGVTSATSTAFTVSPGALDHLSITTQPPASVTAGATFTVAAQLQDQFNNVLTNDNTSVVTLTLSANPGGDSYPGDSATAAAGAVSFNLSLSKAASGYQLSFNSGSKTATTNAFDVIAATPNTLAFVQQPGDVTQGSTLGPISVAVQDGFGNIETGDNSTSVSLSILICSGSIDLGTATVVNGIAVFPNPGSDVPFYSLATGLQVRADATGLPTALSQTFSVLTNSDILFADGFESCRP